MGGKENIGNECYQRGAFQEICSLALRKRWLELGKLVASDRSRKLYRYSGLYIDCRTNQTRCSIRLQLSCGRFTRMTRMEFRRFNLTSYDIAWRTSGFDACIQRCERTSRMNYAT